VNTARYDDDATQARARRDVARADLNAQSSLFTWMRLMHYERLLDRQAIGLHKMYMVGETDSHCTCGLLVEQHALDPFGEPGHRNMTTWEPETLLMVEAEPLTDIYADRRYMLRCQVCGWRTWPAPLDIAHSHVATHQHPPEGDHQHASQ
jgi:hypothetical protein